MTSEVMTKSLNRQTIVDIITAHLYAMSAIDDDVEVTDIDFCFNKEKLITMTIYTKKEVSTKVNG